jgi:hypothetical protein
MTVFGADSRLLGPVNIPMGSTSLSSVTLSADGDFAVSYGSDGRTVQRFDSAGLPQGAAVNVGDYSPVSGVMVTGIDLEPGGGFVATGRRNGFGIEVGGSNLAVLARRFDGAGSPLGDWFLVNTYVIGRQAGSVVATRNGSEFVVVWESQDQDGSGLGIYAQRYIDDDLATVDSVSNPWGEHLVAGNDTFSQVEALRVGFSRSMLVADVTSPTNWQLLENGFDVSSLIAGISYENGVAQISLAEPLHGENYQLIVSDAIHDSLGRAIDGDKNGVAGGVYSIEFGVQQNVFGMGPEIIVPSEVSRFQPPLLAIDEQGGFATIYSAGGWQNQPNPLVRVYDSNGNVPNLSYSLGNVSVSSLIPLDGGQFLALTGGGKVRRFDATSVLEVTSLSGGQSSPTGFAEFARDAYGNFVVVWSRQISLTDTEVVAQRFDADGNSLGAAFAVNAPAPDLQTASSLAMTPSGGFVITWVSRTLNQPGFTAHARRFAADGSPIGAEILIASEAVANPTALEVAADAAGNFTVLWSSYTSGPTTGHIYFQRYAADGTLLGGAVQVNTDTTQVFIPNFDVDATGRALIAWTENDDIIARVYAPDGTPIGEQFQISTVSAYDQGDQAYVGVSMNSLGDAVVAWGTEVASSLVDMRIRRLSLGHPPQLDLNGDAAGIDFQAEAQLDGNAVAIVDSSNLFISNAPDDEFVGGTITIEGALASDVLAVDTTGTSILASYTDGVLTLTGVDSLGHYQQVLRTATFASTASRPGSSTVNIQFVVDDGLATSPIATARVDIYVPGSGSVAARYIYYNNSTFDQPNPAGEDAAIATNKSAYLPGGGLATFSSVTSYSQGINGIMVDLGGLHGVPTLDDFSFKVGNSNDPSSWTSVPLPISLTIRGDAGLAGEDRIEITWSNGAIKNTWLEVTVAANARTGLAAPDVFYFGNKVGDSGTSPGAGTFDTTSTDAAQVFATIGSNKLITDPRDYNRDGQVTSTDAAIVFANIGSLVRIDLPGPLQPLTAVPQGGAVRIDSAQLVATPLVTSAEASTNPSVAEGIASALAIRAATAITPSLPGTAVVTLPRTEGSMARLDERAVGLALADEILIDDDHDELQQDTDDWLGARYLSRSARHLVPWRR